MTKTCPECLKELKSVEGVEFCQNCGIWDVDSMYEVPTCNCCGANLVLAFRSAERWDYVCQHCSDDLDPEPPWEH